MNTARSILSRPTRATRWLRDGWLRTRSRRGVTSLIAMMYLVLMATLAVGFYAVTVTTAQVSNNDERTARALLAADSGVDFVRFHLGSIVIPSTTPASQLFDELFVQLGARLNNTDNMPGASPTISMSPDNSTIYIPAADKFISLDAAGASFRAELHKQGGGSSVRALVFGRFQTASLASSRCIQIDFDNRAQPAPILEYGLATKGIVSLSATAHINAGTASLGSVLTTSAAPLPVSMYSGSVSGDVSMTSGGTINWSGSPSVAGLGPSQWDDPTEHVHTSVAAPAFPAIDTSAYEDYLNAHSPSVIAISTPAGTDFTNVRITAGANPTFAPGTALRGVVVIETPNRVTFSGSATLHGVIVVANSAAGSTNYAGNKIAFDGNFTADDVAALDDSFADLKSLGGGAVVLAPTFSVNFAGASNALGGSIAASRLLVSDTSSVSVTGTVLILDEQPTVLDGTAGITIAAKGPAGGVTGLRFASRYDPQSGSYQEVSP